MADTAFDTTRQLREEILDVLILHSDGFNARAARAYRARLAPDEIKAKYTYSDNTVRLSQHDVRMFLDGAMPYDTPSYADNLSGFYRDALNYLDKMSPEAAAHVEAGLAELRVINPAILPTPLGSKGRPASRTARRQYAQTCADCFTQHAGECP